MRGKVVLLAICALASKWLYSDNKDSDERVFLESYMKQVDSYAWEEFKSNWYVMAFFLDLNGDGIEDVLTTDAYEVDMGAACGALWSSWIKGNGKNTRTYGAYSSRSTEFLKIKRKGFSPQIASIQTRSEWMEGLPVRTEWSLKYVVIDDNNRGRCDCVSNGFARCFADPDFQSFERIYPRVYEGSNLVRRVGNVPPLVRGTASLTAAEKDGLIQAVGEHLRRERQAESPQRINLIPADADLDGRCDAFVASDFDRTVSGEYHWTLYLNTGNSWRKAEEPVYAADAALPENNAHLILPKFVAGVQDFYLAYTTNSRPVVCVFKVDPTVPFEMKSVFFDEGASAAIKRRASVNGFPVETDDFRCGLPPRTPLRLMDWFDVPHLKIERIASEEILWTGRALAQTDKDFLDFYMDKVVDPELFGEYGKIYVPQWYVGLLSFDFDDDGEDEILVTSREQESGVFGNEWLICKRQTNAWKICRLPDGSRDGCFARLQQFFRIQMKNCPLRLAYGNLYGAVEENTNNVEKYPKLTYVYLRDGEMPKFKSVTNGLARCLAAPDFKCLERAIPCRYCGTNLTLTVQEKDHPLMTGAEVLSDDERNSLSQQYGEHLRRERQAKPPQRIKVIPADADADGRCDAFVASDFDRTASGEYRWALYLNTGNGWRKAEKPVYAPYSRYGLKLPQLILPSVTAGTKDFYLICTEQCKPILGVFKYDASEPFGVRTVFFEEGTSELARKASRENGFPVLYYDYLDYLRGHGLLDPPPPHRFMDWFEEWDTEKIRIERIVCEEVVWDGNGSTAHTE